MAKSVVQQINSEMEELQKQLTQFKSSVEYLNNAKESVGKAVDTVNNTNEHFNQRIRELKATYDSFIQLSDSVYGIIDKIDTVNFPERLNNIQKTVKETIHSLDSIKAATVNEVQKAAKAINDADFDGRFKNLQKEISASVKANNEFFTGFQKMLIPQKIEKFETSVNKNLKDQYKELEDNTRQIAYKTEKAILELNLPIRIEKLDANIAGISASIQNIYGRMDSLENNLKERLTQTHAKQINTLNSLQEKVLVALNKIETIQAEKFKKQKTFSIVIIILISIFSLTLFFLK